MLPKKFLLFFVTTFLILALSSFQSTSSLDVHPYHVGSVEFNYNSKSKTFEMMGKFFLDDLENALKEKYGTPVHFNDAKYNAQINDILQQYCNEYLKLKVDNKSIKINYIGFEEDSEAVNIFLESEPVTSPKKVETAVSFLYNFFDDQMNIIHIIVDGKRQSERLNYPNRYLYKVF